MFKCLSSNSHYFSTLFADHSVSHEMARRFLILSELLHPSLHQQQFFGPSIYEVIDNNDVLASFEFQNTGGLTFKHLNPISDPPIPHLSCLLCFSLVHAIQ